MVTVQLAGGIGNVLFQVSTAYALARDTGQELILSTHGWDALTGKHPDTYKDELFYWADWTDKELNFPVCNEPTLPTEVKGDVKLTGYWQDPKYFHKYKHSLEMYYMFNINVDNIPVNIWPMHGETLSLHVRRGDYVRLSHKHPPISIEYIEEAIDTVCLSQVIGAIWLFSDDLEWCKDNIKDRRIEIADTGDDITNIQLMALADHNIISNSTYSWWGAYLNYKGKMVIAPETWYGNKQSPKLNQSFKTL